MAAPSFLATPPRPLNANALARQPEVAAAPTDLVGLGNDLKTFLAAHRFSFPSQPQVTYAPQDELQAQTAVGAQPIAETESDGQIRISPRMQQMGVNGQTAEEMLHEMLHATATGGNPQNATPDQRLATEQAVETEAQDLLPGAMHYLRINPNSGYTLAYRPQVVAERLASAKATGTKWTSPQARAWRANQFFLAPAQRSLVTFQK